ncbi:MAG: hypothetical protein SYC29_18480 [Planctomycetota bacterium]|nr:hypothetical protein [Planctomycetota bacterium]
MDSEAHHRGAPTHVRQTNDCIVLGSRGGRLPDELRARMDDRGWRPVIIEEPHLAMAELCLRDHARRTRSAADGAKAEPPVLVLAGPGAGGGVSGLRAMFDAIRRWLPDASIWLYANEELLPLFGARLSGAGAGDQPTVDPQTTGQRSSEANRAAAPPAVPRVLRLTEPIAAADVGGGEEELEEDEDVAEDEPGRITAEELEMLLQRGPEPDERAGP